ARWRPAHLDNRRLRRRAVVRSPLSEGRLVLLPTTNYGLRLNEPERRKPAAEDWRGIGAEVVPEDRRVDRAEVDRHVEVSVEYEPVLVEARILTVDAAMHGVADDE